MLQQRTIDEIGLLSDEGFTGSEIARRTGCTRTTVSKYKKILGRESKAGRPRSKAATRDRLKKQAEVFKNQKRKRCPKCNCLGFLDDTKEQCVACRAITCLKLGITESQNQPPARDIDEGVIYLPTEDEIRQKAAAMRGNQAEALKFDKNDTQYDKDITSTSLLSRDDLYAADEIFD